MASSVDLAVHRIGSALSGVATTMSGPDGPRALLAALGWDLPPGVADIGLAAIDLADLVSAVEELEGQIRIGTTGLELDAHYAQVGIELAKLLQGIDAVINGFNAAPDYLSKTDILAQFLTRLLDYAVVEAIDTGSGALRSAVTFLGLVELHSYPADPSVYQVEHVRRVVHWERFSQLFGDVRGMLRDVYQWGTPNADPSFLVQSLGWIIAGLTTSVSVRALPRRAEAAFVGHDVPEADTEPMTQLMLSFLRAMDDSGLDVGISVIGLRPTSAGGTDAGIALAPYVFGSAEESFPLTDTLSFSIDTSLDVNDAIALVFRAGSGASLLTNLNSGAQDGGASGRLLASFDFAKADASPIPLLTVIEGLGLQVDSVGLGAGVDVSSGQLSALGSFALKKGELKVDASNLDSFLASIIPLDVTLPFELTFGWSSAHGLFIEGNASPHFDIGLNTSIGPFHLDTLHIALVLGQPDLPLEISFDGSGSLGPLQIAVQRLGITADLKFEHGNLGPVDLDLGLKPPTGLGIEIDAGLAAGGGFISFDPAQGRYAGVLDVTIVDIIAVKVIAVLDTKMPDGSSGFSFLMIITFEFPPIQLGLGFTLNGVGGLGGVNRTMVIDALQAGLRAHTLDDILFPPDPVANATKIVSEIESFFPPQTGRYLFGPMLSIGWGTPTLLDLEVGVILEVPDPIRLAILGEIKATIPDPEFALIALKIQVLGTIDFGLQKLAIDGTMYDSYLLAFQLAGDMALRLNWGDDPDFLFSLGGFNPHFTPPPDVPALARLSVSLGAGENPRLSASSYLAVTSNSLQFGANVDAYAAAGGFAVHGFIGFDALFIFSPFSFEIDFSAGFEISYDGATLAGIRLDASLSGPNPWHLHGDATLTFLFFSVSASLDLTWGDPTVATLPSAPVIPPLVAALGDSRNWSVSLPAAGAPGVSLRSIPAGEAALLVVQPTGVLNVREIVAPLDIPITKFNNATPSDGDQFSISDVELNGTPVVAEPKREDFAIAQFTEMNDADKVSAPSYELFDAGVSLGTVPLHNGHDAERTIEYQDRYIDDYQQSSRLGERYAMSAAVHDVLAKTGAAAAAIATTGLRKFATGASSPISLTRASYVVASTLDLTQRSDILGSATTYYQAKVALESFVAEHPEQREQLQMLPEHELVST
ncbi:MAG: DUF6603 domain-containing protein [Solirubrobacteraceae bacterium]